MKPIKTLTTVLIAILFYSNLVAQNPFEQFGYEVKIVTMTNGKFNEFFDLDTIQQIGEVLINTNTMKMIGFAEKDSINPRPDASVISRWISPDPLAEEYYFISPYAYTLNNPIVFIDPNGMWVDEYKLNQDGTIEFVKESKGSDVLYATDSNNNIDKSKSVTLKEGTLKNTFKATEEGGLSGVKIYNNEEDAKKVFTFAADNFSGENGSKEMEFTLVTGTKVGRKLSVVASENNAGQVHTGTISRKMINKGFTLTEDRHSHPGGATYNIPSGFYDNGTPAPDVKGKSTDRKYARIFDKKNRKAFNHFMYHPQSKKTIMYDENLIYPMN